MKKKILIGLAVFSLVFVLSGVYVILSVERATSRLDHLIELHQVEILREHLLIQIKEVQADLSVKDTPFARSADTMVTHAIQMDKMAARCFGCHHAPEVLERLTAMTDQLEQYKEALSRVLTTIANAERLQAQKYRAFRSGEELIGKVNRIVALTSSNLEKNTSAALAQIRVTKIIVFVLIALGPLLSAAFAFVFIRGFTNPVQVLLSATRRLQGGDLEHRIEAMKDEFGELAAAFNDMAASLKDQMLKMQRTEQMVVAGELAAGLVHEIKNPLAGIKVAMNVLADELPIGQEARSIVDKVTDEVKRLEILMKSFLNFAKPPKPRWESVSVNRFVSATLGFHLQHQLSGSGKADHIRIEQHLDENVPDTTADPVQLQQVLLNLFLNAIDAMPQGGTLTVSTTYEAVSNVIRIEIADTGKGIDAGVKEKIFQPFFTTKSKGTGLGLAICKQLVEQHGGTISADSRPQGGAAFRIELPRGRGGVVEPA